MAASEQRIPEKNNNFLFLHNSKKVKMPCGRKGQSMVITGYRLNATDIADIEKEMMKVRERISNISQSVFQSLAGNEAAFLCDMICTNNVSNDLQGNIMQEAEKRVLAKAESARLSGICADYNFGIYVHLLPYDEHTYLKVTCHNEKLLRAFRTGRIEEYGVSKEEAQDEDNAKTAVWMKLHAMYKDANPPVIDMTPVLRADYEKMKYPSLKERCERLAYEACVNEYLLKVSGGGQIPPYMLIPYVREAQRLAETEDGKRMQAERRVQLMEFLIDLEEDDSALFDESFGKPGVSEI